MSEREELVSDITEALVWGAKVYLTIENGDLVARTGGRAW